MFFLRPVRPNFFTMWPLKTFEFETTDLKHDKSTFVDSVKKGYKSYKSKPAMVFKTKYNTFFPGANPKKTKLILIVVALYQLKSIIGKILSIFVFKLVFHCFSLSCFALRNLKIHLFGWKF